MQSLYLSLEVPYPVVCKDEAHQLLVLQTMREGETNLARKAFR